MVIEITETILDFVNAIAEPKASAKRLLEARAKYDDDELVEANLGRQKMLLSEPVLNQLIESGLWALLEQAAERGDQLKSVMNS